MGLQPILSNPQALENNKLSASPNNSLQTSLQKDTNYSIKLPENLPDDLAEIVSVWPELPEHIKAAIRTLVGIEVTDER